MTKQIERTRKQIEGKNKLKIDKIIKKNEPSDRLRQQNKRIQTQMGKQTHFVSSFVLLLSFKFPYVQFRWFTFLVA